MPDLAEDINTQDTRRMQSKQTSYAMLGLTPHQLLRESTKKDDVKKPDQEKKTTNEVKLSQEELHKGVANERIYKMIADLGPSDRIGIQAFERIHSGKAQTTKTDQEVLRGRGRLYEDETSNKVSAKHF